MSKKDSQLNNYKLSATGYGSPTDSNESVEFFNNLKWMTTNEAAFYLRKSANAIRTAICRGQITAYKFRRRLYFKRSELDRLLETSSTVGG
ncbi:MAG: helix-turn-helix domain-containing protein [Bacteriovorax sp.]